MNEIGMVNENRDESPRSVKIPNLRSTPERVDKI